MARPLQPRLAVRAILLLLFASCSVGDLVTGPDCTEHVDKTIDEQEPTTPAMHMKIESCRLDVDACGVLCSNALGVTGTQPVPNGGTFVGETWDTCDVTFEGDTTHVHVAYTQINSGPNCPVFEEGGPAQP